MFTGFLSKPGTITARRAVIRMGILAASLVFLVFAGLTLAGDRDEGRDGRGHYASGTVLGPNAEIRDFSLADAAHATAVYNTGGTTLPHLPFQLVNGTATVEAGKPLYVPVFFADDSPPIAVLPFPNDIDDEDVAADYLIQSIDAFIGLTDVAATFIEVDGKVTILSDEYTVGVKSEPLADGGGTHYIVSGVFLAPLKSGVHKIAVGAVLTDGTNVGPPAYTITVP